MFFKERELPRELSRSTRCVHNELFSCLHSTYAVSEHDLGLIK